MGFEPGASRIAGFSGDGGTLMKGGSRKGEYFGLWDCVRIFCGQTRKEEVHCGFWWNGRCFWEVWRLINRKTQSFHVPFSMKSNMKSFFKNGEIHKKTFFSGSIFFFFGRS